MKKTLLLICSTVVYFSLSFSQTVDSLRIIPSPATSNEDLKVIAITSFPGGPCSFVSAFSPTQSNNTITFMPIYCYESGTGGCTSTDTHSIGQLSAGDYRLSFELISTNAPGPCGSQTYLLKGIELLDFTVTGGTVGMESEATTIQKIYPNPISDFVMFSFENKAQTDLEIKLLNANGITVKDLMLQAQAGRVNKRIDVADLDKGIYFYMIRTKEIFLSGKLVITD